MKKVILVTLTILAFGMFAMAQMGGPTSDVLGAHLNYGRGCAACHAPHSGAWGNGINGSGDTTSGDVALWGQDVGNLVGKTLLFGGTGPGQNYSETLIGFTGSTPDLNITLCLSCHDGNYAQGAMMRNQVYETLPPTYGTKNVIPTLLGKDGNGTGDYLNDHPVGLNAAVGCGGTYQWDCTETNGVINMNGPKSSEFKVNYGFFVSLSAYNNTAVVTCTTCHNQHLMNVVKVTSSKSGLPPGIYKTMFFIRAPYNPASGTAGSNQTAQFCRQCHGAEANEMNGGDAIPTTF
jgi:cytochrome c553